MVDLLVIASPEAVRRGLSGSVLRTFLGREFSLAAQAFLEPGALLRDRLERLYRQYGTPWNAGSEPARMGAGRIAVFRLRGDFMRPHIAAALAREAEGRLQECFAPGAPDCVARAFAFTKDVSLDSWFPAGAPAPCAVDLPPPPGFLVLINPEGVRTGLDHAAREAFVGHGFVLAERRELAAGKELRSTAEAFYGRHRGTGAFHEMCLLTIGHGAEPAVALRFVSNDAMALAMKKARQVCLRLRLCVPLGRAVHVSETPADAAREVAIWFPPL